MTRGSVEARHEPRIGATLDANRMMKTAGTARITGAGRGIGREVAHTLASEGWGVPTGGVFQVGRAIGKDGSTGEATKP